MQITSTAISLNVPEVEASARFASEHFGFTTAMSADGFVSLEHPTAGVNVVFLQTGLATFKPQEIAGPAGQGLLMAFVVDDLDAEYARISAAGARVITPPETEEWGERYCQFADANGIVWQLVQWVSAPPEVEEVGTPPEVEEVGTPPEVEEVGTPPEVEEVGHDRHETPGG